MLLFHTNHWLFSKTSNFLLQKITPLKGVSIWSISKSSNFHYSFIHNSTDHFICLWHFFIFWFFLPKFFMRIISHSNSYREFNDWIVEVNLIIKQRDMITFHKSGFLPNQKKNWCHFWEFIFTPNRIIYNFIQFAIL